MDALLKLLLVDFTLLLTLLACLLLTNMMVGIGSSLVLAPALAKCEKRTFEIAKKRHIKF